METKNVYCQAFLTGECAPFGGANLKIVDTIFADGESPLKESHDIVRIGSMFKWKYSLGHTKNSTVEAQKKSIATIYYRWKHHNSKRCRNTVALHGCYHGACDEPECA